MDTSKLRTGEIVAAVGALVLLIALLFFDWYSFGVDVEIPFGGGDYSQDLGAWDGQGFLGSIFNIIIFVAAAVGIGQAVVKLTSTKVSLPVALSALTAAGGVAAVVMVVLRILIKPDTGTADIPGVSTDLAFGIFVALAGAIVLAVGGWMSMKDEGTSFSEAREQIGAKMSAETPSAPPPPQEPPSSEPPPPPPPPPPSEEGPPSSGGAAA